jgi:hypothetical protein
MVGDDGTYAVRGAMFTTKGRIVDPEVDRSRLMWLPAAAHIAPSSPTNRPGPQWSNFIQHSVAMCNA